MSLELDDLLKENKYFSEYMFGWTLSYTLYDSDGKGNGVRYMVKDHAPYLRYTTVEKNIVNIVCVTALAILLQDR